MANYYELLGVKNDASQAEIKQAYRQMASKYHPDNNLDKDTTGIMQEISLAYQTLSDEKSRKIYDDSLENISIQTSQKSYTESPHTSGGIVLESWSDPYDEEQIRRNMQSLFNDEKFVKLYQELMKLQQELWLKEMESQNKNKNASKYGRGL